MFGFKGRDVARATLIAAGTTVRGDLEFSGQLIVSGVVEGNVASEDDSGNATLIVSKGGRVIGQVHVPRVEVHGCISGDVRATTHVKLAAEAEVNGDVYYKVIEVAEGANVNGRLLRDSTPVSEPHTVQRQEPTDAASAPRPVAQVQSAT